MKAHKHDIAEGNESKASGHKPTLVLVQHGILVGQFPTEQAAEADQAVERLEMAGGHHVWIYEVDERLPDPPKVGTEVDPVALGWASVE